MFTFIDLDNIFSWVLFSKTLKKIQDSFYYSI